MIRHNSIQKMPAGYHTLAAAPGYRLWYLALYAGNTKSPALDWTLIMPGTNKPRPFSNTVAASFEINAASKSDGASADLVRRRPRGDDDLFEQVRAELFTAVVGDVMDAAGLTNQFLPPTIRPLRPDMVVVGRAMTVLESDCADSYVATDGVKRPFGLMLRALDDLMPGEVYLCTGASPVTCSGGTL